MRILSVFNILASLSINLATAHDGHFDDYYEPEPPTLLLSTKSAGELVCFCKCEVEGYEIQNLGHSLSAASDCQAQTGKACKRIVDWGHQKPGCDESCDDIHVNVMEGNFSSCWQGVADKK